MINNGVIIKEVLPDKIRVDECELSARLGFACSCMEDRLTELLPDVMAASTPKYAAVKLPVSYTDDGLPVIDGVRIDSRHLAKNFDGAKEAYLLAVTLGAGVDRYLIRLGMLSGSSRFVADAVASALTEALCDLAEGELLSGIPHRSRFSPGYGDLPLAIQDMLLSRLGAESTLGITLTEKMLMVPMKSITAIIGICDRNMKKM